VPPTWPIRGPSADYARLPKGHGFFVLLTVLTTWVGNFLPRAEDEWE